MDAPLPKVSIIVPAYNHAPWVEQALESVFAQTFRDWELIIIDDASTDDTWDIIQTALKSALPSDPDNPCPGDSYLNKITVQRHSGNQGAPATLNEGLSLARGEYIAILNSDDVWHENRLARLYEYAHQSQRDFVATAVRLWDKDSRLKNASEPHWVEWYQSLQRDWDNSGDFLHALLLGNFLITTSNFFFRRDLYERLGGFAERRYVHDYEYALRLYQGGARMACLWDDALLNYRLHGDNTIRERPRAAIQENMAMLLEQLPRLYQHLNASHLHALCLQLADLFRYYGEEWQSEVHWCLVAKEKELFGLIEDRDRWVAARDVVIQAQQQDIQERDHWVADRDRWVAERDALIARLQEDIKRQQGWIQERESWLTDRDEMISKRDRWVAERDAWVLERDAWVSERDQCIAQLNLERERLLSSLPFRLGNAILHPLRSLRDRLQARKWRPGHA